MAGKTFVHPTYALNVYANGSVAEGNGNASLTMADVEMDVRILQQGRLSVFTNLEMRLNGQSILLLQTFTQQQVTKGTFHLPLTVTKTQGLFASPVGQVGKCLLQDSITDGLKVCSEVNHFSKCW